MAATSNRGTLFSLISLFFLWGLLTSLNDILVPYFKENFDLPNWLAQFVQLFFFAAYLVMAFPGGWVIQRIGYQKGIVLGLSLMAVGCLIFYPAASMGIFGIFLLGLFVLASGITFLQVAANPYVVAIGDETSGASRLNLAQGFNSLGHVLAPLAGTVLILQNTDQKSLDAVQTPYLILAGILITGALAFSRLKLPNLNTQKAASINDIGGFLRRNPAFILSMLAIFFYVGSEIAVGSVLVDYFKEDPSIAIPKKLGGFFVSLYWGSAMLGRFLGSIALGDKSKQGLIKMVGLAAVAIFIIFSIPYFSDLYKFEVATGLSCIIVVNLLAFILLPQNPAKLLSGFAAFNIVLLAITMLGKGNVALYAVLGVGLFNSIMWSNIFALAIKGKDQDMPIASSLLVSMIVGGALLPPLQGLMADFTTLKTSFLIPMTGFAYLVFYGMRKQ